MYQLLIFSQVWFHSYVKESIIDSHVAYLKDMGVKMMVTNNIDTKNVTRMNPWLIPEYICNNKLFDKKNMVQVRHFNSKSHIWFEINVICIVFNRFALVYYHQRKLQELPIF